MCVRLRHTPESQQQSSHQSGQFQRARNGPSRQRRHAGQSAARQQSEESESNIEEAEKVCNVASEKDVGTLDAPVVKTVTDKF